MVINILIYTLKSFVSVIVNIHICIIISNSSTRKHQCFKKCLLFLNISLTMTYSYTLFTLCKVNVILLLAFMLFLCFIPGLNKNHFLVRINPNLYYEFEKCSSMQMRMIRFMQQEHRWMVGVHLLFLLPPTV